MRLKMSILTFLTAQNTPINLDAILAAFTPHRVAIIRFAVEAVVKSGYAAKSTDGYTITEAGRVRYASLASAHTLTNSTRRLLQHLQDNGHQIPERLQGALRAATKRFEVDSTNLQHIGFVKVNYAPFERGRRARTHYAITPAGQAALAAA